MISGLSHPTSVAVDANGKIYVAQNGAEEVPPTPRWNADDANDPPPIRLGGWR